MKNDLDRLMDERGLDAILVMGKVLGNPPMKYLVGSAGITGSIIVKRKGERCVLIHGVMEREEALSTGMETMDFEDFGNMEIIKSGKRHNEAQKELLKRIFGRLEIRGRVGLYGRMEISGAYSLMEDLEKEVEDIEWVREREDDIFTDARVTKDLDEIEAIRSAGRRTGEVIREVADMFRSAERIDGTLVNRESGEPLKVRDVKRFITYSLARKGMLENEETIFSIGYDTAVPHNRGKDEDSIVEGQPIIFDIFPSDARSGYNYDCTRSIIIGDPTDEYLRLYEDVRGAVELAEGFLAEGASGSGVNHSVIEFFEARGHSSLRTEGNFTNGFIHSLGHGIGLNVHEVPSLGLVPGSRDTLEKGMVFTVEPGLYYPGRSIGVRLENCYWINEDGVGEKVVEIPYIHHIE